MKDAFLLTSGSVLRLCGVSEGWLWILTDESVNSLKRIKDLTWMFKSLIAQNKHEINKHEHTGTWNCSPNTIVIGLQTQYRQAKIQTLSELLGTVADLSW